MPGAPLDEAVSPDEAPSPDRAAMRFRLVTTLVIAVLAAAAVGGSAALGAASRRAPTGPGAAPARRWAAVSDAAEAVHAFRAAGVHGRKLLVLTGRWSRLTTASPSGAVVIGPAAGILRPGAVDPENALLAAARLGIARALLVVMPAGPYATYRDAVRDARGVELGDGWLVHRYHGYLRRFSVPGAPPDPGEPVLVLVEPSFFDDGAPRDPVAWLRDNGIAYDVALVALADPGASPRQRAAASELAAAVGATGARP